MTRYAIYRDNYRPIILDRLISFYKFYMIAEVNKIYEQVVIQIIKKMFKYFLHLIPQLYQATDRLFVGKL